MLTEIVIHLVPKEIDWFEWQSIQLKDSSFLLNSEDVIIVNVTLNLNLINWKDSQIPKQFFINKFNNIKKLYDWCEAKFFIDDNNICMGLLDKRRDAIINSSADNILFLDCDMIFNKYTLKYMIESAKVIPNEYYIVSPQIVKLWDTTWDVLVNEKYKDYPLKYYEIFDSYEILNQSLDDVSIKSIDVFKFAGGWFNLISTNLLKLITIPIELGSYGPDDSFIMEACNILVKFNYDVKQYILNIINLENIKYRNNSYEGFISEINMRELHLKIAHDNFTNELNKFVSKLQSYQIN